MSVSSSRGFENLNGLDVEFGHKIDYCRKSISKVETDLYRKDNGQHGSIKSVLGTVERWSWSRSRILRSQSRSIAVSEGQVLVSTKSVGLGLGLE